VEAPVVVGGEGARRVGDLGFQIVFSGGPAPVPPAPEPEPEPQQVIDDRQLAFPFAGKWRNKAGGWERPKRAPVRARTGYSKGLAAYYLEQSDARVFWAKRLTRTQGSFSSVPAYAREWAWLQDVRQLGENLVLPASLRESLGILREYSGSGIAGCSTHWRQFKVSDEVHIRPEGCGHERLCSMCGPAAAGALARDAVTVVLEEVRPAVQRKLGPAKLAGEQWTLPLHEKLSEALECLLMINGVMAPVGKERLRWKATKWTELLNWLRREQWKVTGLRAPGGVRLGGYSAFQSSGESSLGAHYHFHNFMLPVGVKGRDVARGLRKLRDESGEDFGSRVVGTDLVVDGLVYYSEWVSPETLTAMRVAWAKVQNRLAKKLAKLGVGVDWEPLDEGVVNRRYFKGDKAGYAAAKSYLSYMTRWVGGDLAGGLKPGGDKLTWTGPVGSEPDPGRFPAGARHVGHTAVGQPVYERDVKPLELVRAVWRLDAEPENWPSLSWLGFMSTGKVKAFMAYLGMEQEPADGGGGGDWVPGRWKPVERRPEGLVFELVGDEGIREH